MRINFLKRKKIQRERMFTEFSIFKGNRRKRIVPRRKIRITPKSVRNRGTVRQSKKRKGNRNMREEKLKENDTDTGTDTKTRSILTDAIVFGKLRKIDKRILHDEKLWTSKDKQGWTLLHFAFNRRTNMLPHIPKEILKDKNLLIKGPKGITGFH